MSATIEHTAGLNRRILVVDDHPAIHDDFRKILGQPVGRDSTLADDEAFLFDQVDTTESSKPFELDSAFQGQEALVKVRQALAEKRPYAMAFVDVRMPPGWDGIETISHLWKEDPNLQVVICTAYSDHSWSSMTETLGVNDKLLILKKPFDLVEVMQLAHALTAKWELARTVRSRMDELETLVRIRTSELISAQRSKNDFLANISHELLTPMNGVLGMAELMSITKLDPEQMEYLTQIERSGASLLAIIKNILEFNSIEAGRVKLSVQYLDLEEVLAKAAKKAGAEAAARQNAIRVEVDGKTPRKLGGDPARIAQVVGLLLENAVKFTEKGTITVRAFPELETEVATNVVISVEDTGIGIAPDVRERLTASFSQADGSMKRKYGGIGMGLTICRSLVGLMGGQMSFDSAAGQGAVFRFGIPLLKSVAALDLDDDFASTPAR